MMDLVRRFVTASEGFGRALRLVDSWTAPTPCTDWDVRALANHVTQGNLNYVRLLDGVSAAEFLLWRDSDALGNHPVAAFDASVRACANAYSSTRALDRLVDHPSGQLTGAQALAVRTTDTVIHTWDMARAVDVDETLDPTLVAWIEENLHEIYAGMAETPVSPQTTHRFFAAPTGTLPADASDQDRLLHLFGRQPRP
jgi:uncharacterized protein (TIGR03086 family)